MRIFTLLEKSGSSRLDIFVVSELEGNLQARRCHSAPKTIRAVVTKTNRGNAENFIRAVFPGIHNFSYKRIMFSQNEFCG